MSVALLVARLLLAGVFAAAACGKLADIEGTSRSMREFGLPARLARPAAILLPALELAVAVGLLLVGPAWWAALAAAVLLLVFCAAIVRLMARGEAPECNCFGSAGSTSVGPGTLARNALFLLVAGCVLVAGGGGAGASAFAWAGAENARWALAGVALLVLMAAQATFSWQLFKQNGRLLVRISALETGAQQARSGDERLAPGSVAPDFVLPDLDGRLVTLDDFLAFGRGALLVFTDPGCAHCTPLLPAIAAAQGGGVYMPLAVISTGEVAANRSRADEHGIGQMLLQEGFAVAERYRIHGAPAAVVIDEAGLVTGTHAEGARAVRTLIDSLAPVEPERQSTAGQLRTYEGMALR